MIQEDPKETYTEEFYFAPPSPFFQEVRDIFQALHGIPRVHLSPGFLMGPDDSQPS